MSSDESDKTATVVKTLAKGLAALDLLQARTTVRTSDLATELDIDKGGASRLLKTLATMGYAEVQPDRSFSVGRKLKSKNERSQHAPSRSLRERVRPHLERLAQRTHESIHLGVPADEYVFYIDAIEANFPLRVDSRPGTFGPIDCTAMGRIFMAYGLAAVPKKLEARTVNTITDLGLLGAELQRIRQSGVALQDEEYYIGMRGVAAPIFNANGAVVGAIGVSGPSVRVTSADLPDLSRMVSEIASGVPFD